MQSNFALVLEQTVVDPDNEAPLQDMTEFDLERNMVTALPPGAKLGSVDASQPVDTFRDYNNEMVMEASAPGNMPHNMVKGSSADMNFSSARFDYYIMFGKDRDILRSDMEIAILDDLIMQYVNEWALLNFSKFPGGIPEDIHISYGYEVDKYIDPLKESKADALRVERNAEGRALMSQKDYFASQGKDWREERRQQLIEEQYDSELRLELFGDETEDNNTPIEEN